MPDPTTALNPEQRAAYDAVLSGKSLFLTGPGGTGKSFLLATLYRDFKHHTGRTIAITALTGCAALLLGPHAKTLHSWAGIGLGKGDPVALAKSIAVHQKKRARWRKTDCLVIDEVSMMTPGLLELLDRVGRTVRKREDQPFGGMQLVFVGDFYQLPPVTREGKTAFAFESPLWPQVVQETIQLTTIVRQADPVFQKILGEARIGRMSPESMAALAARRTKTWKKQRVKPTLLFTKNQEVSEINEGQLDKLEGLEHTFTARTILPPTGVRIPEDVLQMILDKLDKDAPYEPELRLKVGAQVMLLVNLDPAVGLVNGSRGVITEFGPDGMPHVEFLRGPGTSVKIVRHQWKTEEESPIIREQIPLRLAYAITIHKAQGATLDSALVDVGPSTFEYGQAYVALSRVRSLESLYVYELHEGAFRAHPTVSEFYARVMGTDTPGAAVGAAVGAVRPTDSNEASDPV